MISINARQLKGITKPFNCFYNNRKWFVSRVYKTEVILIKYPNRKGFIQIRHNELVSVDETAFRDNLIEVIKILLPDTKCIVKQDDVVTVDGIKIGIDPFPTVDSCVFIID